MTPAELAALLRPIDLAGRETVRFRLDGFTSVVTRELLTLRLRRQEEVFETGADMVGTQFSADGTAIEVDAAAMLAANAVVTARLEGVAGSIHYLRKLGRARDAVQRRAAAFETALAAGRPPSAVLLGYLDADTMFQTLGALRFCLPGDLRARLDALVPGDADVLLAAEQPSQWIGVRLRELALARARHRNAADRYVRLRRGFRRSVGYLGGEDVDFEAEERDAAIDARVAACGNLPAIAASLAALAAARDADRRRRRDVTARFTASGPPPRLMALALLARALAAHDDENRRAKMRLLRNLRDLGGSVSLDPTLMTLAQLLAPCAT